MLNVTVALTKCGSWERQAEASQGFNLGMDFRHEYTCTQHHRDLENNAQRR